MDLLRHLWIRMLIALTLTAAAATSESGAPGAVEPDGIIIGCILTCPANITVSNDPQQCGAVVTFAPTVSGRCGGVVSSPASGSFFPKGTTTVTCSTRSGEQCTFNVTVVDTQPPTITCPANITVSNNPNQCGAVVNYSLPGASDNCPGVTVTASPASGSFFPKGTTTVTATATDATSNFATCTFTITVQDTEAPLITCPDDVTVLNDPGLAGAIVHFDPPIASDNCPGVTVVCDPPSGSTFPIGTTTVTCTAEDASVDSLDAACTFDVTVEASIDVKRPSGGDLLRGFRIAVRWESIGNLGDNVKIDLFRNGNFVSTIKDSTPNDGKQRWKVPDALSTGRGYKVRVTSIDMPSIFGESDRAFRVRAPH